MQKNPINIELESHTDCRASHYYNNALSQRRAEFKVTKYDETLEVGYDKMERPLKGDVYDLNYFNSGFFTKCN